ncbi:MAG: hypothetical protein ABI834_06965 [Ginsengibacter sp.]
MIPEELSMTEAESMQLITSMINKAKNRFNETGFLYLVWGWVILICCITQFIATYFFKSENAYYVWFVTWIVLIYQIFFLRKKRKSRKVRTYTDEINQYVWIVFFICETLLIFILIQLKKYEAINPAILVMYGMPTFLLGIIFKFKPLSIGGIFCWSFAAISPFINPEFHLLLIACAIIAGWIIPGYLLKQKFKKEN